MNNKDIFFSLSKILTGQDRLDEDISEQYYHQLQQKMGIYLDELVGIYRKVDHHQQALDLLLERIKDNKQLLHVAQQIVRIWYISQFKELPDVDPTKSPKPEVYAGYWKKGILWDIIKAHPPAYSDQPHGYWVEKPKDV